jgi:deazaflavin-dependent oxidoreductase (nitroreductase family)
MTDMTAGIAKAAAAPSWVTLFNPVTRFFLRAGIPLGPNGLLTVTGRKSGVPRTVPVAIIDVSGRRYVWAPWGAANWVLNLRAAGRATITVRGDRVDVRAAELDPAERVAWFRDTLRPVARRMRFGVSFVRIVDGVDLDGDLAAAANGRAVFELHPIS